MDIKRMIGIDNITRGVSIYGTGLAAQMGCGALERLSVNCECFIDADDGKWGGYALREKTKY